MTTILVSCMGGYGSLNVIEDLRNASFGRALRFVGTHADPYMLCRSTAEVNYLVPWAKDIERYVERTKEIISEEGVDFFIPKSDAEVVIVSEYRNAFDCDLFLPDHDEVIAAQDKFSFYEILQGTGVPVAETYHIRSYDDIAHAMSQLPKANKYWLRVKTAGLAGAFAATWVRTPEQARMWVQLWQELSGVNLTEFTVSEFLPGRLFECLVIFKDGELKLGKVYENVRFHMGNQRAAGDVGSTPELAKTCSDDIAVGALREAIKAVETVGRQVGSRPNGVYHLSAKQNESGRPCVTECNIGRLPSTAAFFNRTGRYNATELFVRYGLDMMEAAPNPVLDLEEREIFMIRTLDRELTLKSREEIEACANVGVGNRTDSPAL